MKLLVSTKKTQRKRNSDFSFVKEGEVVFSMGRSHDGEAIDGGCGCQRAFFGICSLKGTTTARVAEMSITPDQLRRWLIAGMKKMGWERTRDARRMESALQTKIRDLIRVAKRYETGAIIERRGSRLRVRREC